MGKKGSANVNRDTDDNASSADYEPSDTILSFINLIALRFFHG